MISTSAALTHLLKLTTIQKKEVIPIEECYNRVLANNLVAQHSQPPFSCSAMDGYALNLKNKVAGSVLRVVGESAAGQGYENIVKLEEAVRIFTGAPLPQGTNCVVIQEDVYLENRHITINNTLEESHFVRKMGSDFPRGYVIEAPVHIKPPLVSLIAAMNFNKVQVYRKPQIAIIATGSELISPGKKIRPNKIVSSNSYGLAAMLKSFGATPHIFPIVEDSSTKIKKTLETAKDFDLIITIGGVSVGDYDLILKSAEALKMKLAFHGVAMKPGKPLLAGTINNKLIIGLPGNPVSALICCQIMVKPVVEKMLGLERVNADINLLAHLGTKLKKNGAREHYVRGVLKQERGTYVVYPIFNQDSSLLTELNKSNSLIKRIPFAPAVDAGQPVEVLSFFN